MGDKRDAIIDLIRNNHVTVLLETRTNSWETLLQQLPGIGHFSLAVSDSGRKGQGVAIFVHSTIKDRCRLWKTSATAQAIWVRCEKSIWGLDHDVFLGGAYIPPARSEGGSEYVAERATEIADSYFSLTSDVQEILSVSGLPFLCGDFNAKIGRASEFSDFEVSDSGDNLDLVEMVVRFPELGGPRDMAGNQRGNLSGTAMMDMAVACGLVCTTGRGRGDRGQPTCRGSTRTEHALLHPDLYALPLSAHFLTEVQASDHTPFTLHFDSRGLETEGLHGAGHVCGEECRHRRREEVSLRWVAEKAEDYRRQLLEDEEGIRGIEEAVAASDIKLADQRLHEVILRAAAGAGMVRPWKCPLAGKTGAQRPAWFDQECRDSRRALRQALGRADSHAYQALKKEHRRRLRRVERRWKRGRAEWLIDRLEHGDPAAFKLLRKQKPRVTTPIGAGDWASYLQRHFAPPPPAPPPLPPPPGSERTRPPGRMCLWGGSAVGQQHPPLFTSLRTWTLLCPPPPPPPPLPPCCWRVWW